jgi:predicted ATPase
MIRKIEIENYKSIEKLDFEIGRFNVFIGENGCGKTNVLEAVAFAASADNLKNVVLSSKGVRSNEPEYYRSGFDQGSISKDLRLTLFDNDGNAIDYYFDIPNAPYREWRVNIIINNGDILNSFDEVKEENVGKLSHVYADNDMIRKLKATNINEYILFSLENSYLRNYNSENGYAQPLGSKGEGLLKLIKVIKKEKLEEYKEIIENLHLIDWFSNIDITEDDLSGSEFKISDKYLEDGIGTLDIKNANEGFFLLLFYITLFVSDYTPSFFAIDNIDTALNPKLCTKLIEILAKLAAKHNKQVLITTHNPSILDGINLNDNEQRLFAVSRNKVGYTRLTRIEKKQPLEGEKSLKLSEQFLRGYIGGIPKNF